ncbi:TetR family transcriptional regulator [Pseudarthrobacter scleromae]|uniref:TetR family transcriptional regulator n=1 Tax=Pseudarthrobacter scleromae TaxID=158897 RepID=UPI003D05EA45
MTATSSGTRAKSGTRGPYQAGIRRRRQILETSVEVFGQFGYNGGSLRQIADRIGVTPTALLHHFGSKEGLLVAVLEYWDDQSDVITGRDFTGLTFIDKQRLVMAKNATLRGLIELFASLSTEATDPAHPAHDFFIRRYRRVFETFEGAFESAKAAGEVRQTIDPAVESRLLIATFDGLQIQWLLEPEIPVTAIFAAHIEGLVDRITLDAPRWKAARLTETVSQQ